jgi:FlaA1/EpsC-like NDP-sugar epimerase
MYNRNTPHRLVRVMLNLTFKRRLLEMILDFVIILLAFYLAFITRYGLFLSEVRLTLFTQALPVALGVSYLLFLLTGVYQSVWRYIGVDDFVRYFKAAAGSMLAVGGAVYLLYFLRNDLGARSLYSNVDSLPPAFVAYSPSLFLLFAVFLFLGLATSRSSFRVLDRLFGQQARTNNARILIVGAGDAGEMGLYR